MPYVRLTNLIRQMKSDSQTELSQSQVELLAFIIEECSLNRQLKITDLLYHRDFGTGQTISNKVSLLTKQGYIKQEASPNDARIKIIKPTDKADRYFQHIGKVFCKLCSE